MLINNLLKQKKKLHFTTLDSNKQSPSESAKLAKLCAEFGTDAIMVGGSTGIIQEVVNATVQEIKKEVALPIILFPNGAGSISKYAEHILFMSLLNSNNARYLIKEQAMAAQYIKKYSINPISVGFIVISTSKIPTTVEKIGQIDIIRGTDIKKALDYALAAQYLGMSCIFLEAGSGADKPVPNDMIAAIKKEINIPLIVGGGIRDATTAKEKIESGADVIVTGTIIEKDISKLKNIIKAIHDS